ncbi:formate dehydrogenase accessory sulfurtransferase FdhD [Aneurinibacillus thermoaerophilus]|uniref:Sulfur carrier protein FdhD n=1 Tax=Aneurinibacillus thermoaerophilus TaxID=143495 RepID=A0A1G8DID2_ANETH|nr:formate dehydrogenase accessory sulfurtransferase FdhD [Aneurinibacillus thermoaerophilus]MED0674210.1 formate dehydrogenase accessory sulfurtransferase FdhD [Aneurinibacillus thermoaerophilus]MED0736763.1 formate dehydrogenase accessory sulfurtransferase FdhD [Aneurinibacillus thermoaerophilus]MED0758264.1 formate dehydrogenase accessory sulfurtransferase FdhD [Aneurinibacillus thermoaerophilus]MED0761929.1 formate dehydrogenase accessory sulfurtransferase FdhD [Aneurinibacillus thermoaerop
MPYPVVRTRQILRYKNNELYECQDEVVNEFPLTIFLDEEEFATVVCTPEYVDDLVIGFLASEGVIRSYQDIKNLIIQEQEGFAYVELHKAHKISQQFYSKRYISSCCGKSRQNFYFYNDARTAKVMTEKNVTLTIEECFRLIRLMQEASALFQSTGGAHNAALCDRNGIVLARTDIGRHNALDKIYGFCLKNAIPVHDKIIAFSGRISSEVLLKVAKIGCEIVLSKSAPTELALQLAEDLSITAVGFIRDSSLNVYTHPERIKKP